MPNEKYEDIVIPVGVIATIGSKITFSTKAINILATYNVYLENRTNKTFIRLDEAESDTLLPFQRYNQRPFLYAY